MDLEKLRASYKVVVGACLGVTMAPLLFAFVAYIISTEPDPGPPNSDPTLLVAFGVLALVPFIAAPLLRRMARAAVANAKPAEAAGALVTWSLVEYAVWEIPSLLGFVAFIATSQLWFFAACMAVTFVGYAFSFPRWSRWEALAGAPRPMGEASAPAPL